MALNMRTTILLCVWLLATLSSFGANPSYTVFRGTGGVLVTTNPPTGLIIIDGSGVFTSSGTNATLSIATNGVAINNAATQLNLVIGTNMFLTATNSGSVAHIGIHLVDRPDTISSRYNGVTLSLNTTQLNLVPGYNMVLRPTNNPNGNVSFGFEVRNPMLLGTSGIEFGHWSDTAVGFSNASSASLSLANLDPGSGDDWTFAGNIIVLTMPGTGNGVSISPGGILQRTNFASTTQLTAVSNALVLLSSNVAPAPPLNSVQFNSNGVQQGSADFLFSSGVATVGQGVEVTTGSFVLNGGTTALVAWNGLGRIRWDADGVMRLENDAANNFNRINFRDNTAASPALGVTNGDFIVLGGNGNFKIGGSTNKLIVPAIHIANDGGVGTPLLSLDNPLSAIRWDLAIDSNPQTYFLGLGRVGDTIPTMVWELGGNVGINTTNPATALDVQGRTMLRSNVYFPNISSNALPVALLATDSQGEVYETAVPTVGASAETNSVLTNLVGTVARNVTNVVSLSTTNATSKPLTNSYANGTLTLFGVEAGANVTITPNGSNLVIAATASGGGASTNEVLTNLVGTVGRNITNFVSLSTSNATSKPLTNSYMSGVVTVFGVEAGANITVTPNGSNLVIAASASGGGGAGSLAVNDNQFVTNSLLNFKSGALTTNVQEYGAVELGHVTFSPDNTYDIGASGATRPRTIYVAGNVFSGGQINATTLLGWGNGINSEGFYRISDGVWRATDASGANWNRFQLGGTDAASPAIGKGPPGFTGDLIIFGADGVAFGSTNRLHVPGGIVLTNANVAAGKVWTAVGGFGGGTWSNAPAGGGTVSGHTNAIPFINPAGDAFTYIDAYSFGSLTNPGFGFVPKVGTGVQPHGYGGLMVYANDPMGLVTIGHPNPGSDFATFATALVISNRYNSAADFKNDMIKIEAVEVLGGLRHDSTMTRWRVWQGQSGQPHNNSSNDVAEINLNGQIKLYGGTLYRSNTVALPTAEELGAGGYWVGVSNNAAANTLVSIYSTDGTTTIMKHLVP